MCQAHRGLCWDSVRGHRGAQHTQLKPRMKRDWAGEREAAGAAAVTPSGRAHACSWALHKGGGNWGNPQTPSSSSFLFTVFGGTLSSWDKMGYTCHAPYLTLGLVSHPPPEPGQASDICRGDPFLWGASLHTKGGWSRKMENRKGFVAPS